jgi:hypothetical protein
MKHMEARDKLVLSSVFKKDGRFHVSRRWRKRYAGCGVPGEPEAAPLTRGGGGRWDT